MDTARLAENAVTVVAMIRAKRILRMVLPVASWDLDFVLASELMHAVLLIPTPPAVGSADHVHVKAPRPRAARIRVRTRPSELRILGVADDEIARRATTDVPAEVGRLQRRCPEQLRQGLVLGPADEADMLDAYRDRVDTGVVRAHLIPAKVTVALPVLADGAEPAISVWLRMDRSSRTSALLPPGVGCTRPERSALTPPSGS
jgi:hypothetical protein